ncbi:SRPBCC family protein [Leifsonia sp. NPDC058248]|uniref:SRPBCC family protein n=1 Tax=Leifsonia sp. NPDC058248 TaxID=3346402 RepID=UPI0036D8637B
MTENEPSVVDRDEFTVRRTITIAAPLEKVWAAITEVEHIARWFPQAAVLDGVAVGAGGVFTFEGYGDVPVQIEELDPPRMIAYRWGSDSSRDLRVDLDRSTVFRFTLEPVATGTQLTVVESGFDALTDPATSMENNRGGWDSELDELVAYLEGGS